MKNTNKPTFAPAPPPNAVPPADGRNRHKGLVPASVAPALSFVTDARVRAMVSGVLTDPAPPLLPDTAPGDSAPVYADSHNFVAPVYADDAAAIALYRADALALLPRFAPESFDLVFADPPYFLSGGGMTCQSGKRVSVNKGAWDEPTTLAAMHEFNRAWLAACYRLLKPDGTIFVTGTHHNIHSAGFALLELGYKILNDVAWFKVNPPPNLSCRYFTHATETILWARKNTPDARHYFDYAAMKADNNNKQMQSLWAIKPPAPREKTLGGEAHLSDINCALAQSPTLRQTRTWTCTVRRVVRQSPGIEPVERGRYRLWDGGVSTIAAQSRRGQLSLLV